MKRFFGFLLILIGIIFVFAAVGRFTSLISNLIGIGNIFDSSIDGYERGQIFGGFIYWILHFVIIYFAFKYGRKLLRKSDSK